VRDRATVFEQGQESDSLAFVESGAARVVRYMADGREAVLAFLGVGDVIGEIGCLGGLPRSATVEAVGDLTLKTIRRGELITLLQKEPDLALSFISVLCARLADTDLLLSSFSTLRMRGRLAHALLQLAKRHGEKIRLGVRIQLPLSQRELGAFAGLSRENTSRIFAAWRDEGLVTTDADNCIILKSAEAIERISEGDE
jgi:CRP/FNR family transcriptional regulator, cyclic AMP receptor protein